MTAFTGASMTDAGRVRSSNQDLGLVTDDLVAVADGMGGHVGGEVAARVAIEALRLAFASSRSASGLVAAVNEANRAVFDQSEREAGLKGMGTTLTAAALARAGRTVRLVVANVGDSRAYLLVGGRLRQLTEDHSLVEEMVRNGELTSAEAAVHPHRHILTRALGIERSVTVDSWELDAAPGSRLLLCSDGLTNECSDEEITSILTSSSDPDAAAHRLVAAALEHGGSDNVTVVVVDVDGSAASPADETSARRHSSGATADAKAGSGAGAGMRNAAVGAAAATTGLAASARRGAAVGPRSQRGGAATTRQQGQGASHRTRAERVLSMRAVLFVVAFVGVLGGAAGFVGWYVKASYFVGIDKGYVTVFEGRPGGFLWFRPQVLDKTSTPLSQVFAPNVAPLRAGMLQPSFAAAESVAAAVTSERRYLALPVVNTTGALGVVGTTTTTLPPVTTTTRPKATTTSLPGGRFAGHPGRTTSTTTPGGATSTSTSTTSTTTPGGATSTSTSTSTTTVATLAPPTT